MNARIWLSAGILVFAGGDKTPQSPFAVKLKDGTVLYGRVNSEDGAAEVVVNTYNTRIKSVTHGVERVPSAKLQKIEKAKNPWAEYAERARKAGSDAAERLALGKLLKDAGFKSPGNEELLRAHLLAPSDPAAAKAIGDADWKKLSKSDPRLNADLKTAVDAYLAEEEFTERKKIHERLAREFQFPKSFLYMERARRSKQQKTGRQDDRALTLRSKQNKGVYTLFVPSKYDPLTPWPLVLALHGGGPGGKDGKDVVGSGSSAMNFYSELAERRGFLVICPTAIAAPWNQPANEPFLLAALEEILLLYNVDENRVYLTGHSMGGFGTWNFGPKHNELFAVIAPMSGGGSNNFQKLAEMGTGVYLYHGADDEVVKVGDSRRAGDTMKKDGMDFIYAEVPDSGHGLPREVLEECFDFFEAHRLHATPDRGTKGKFEITKDALSSFERKVSNDEKEYFEDPLKAPARDTVPALIADLKKGGGSARDAAAKLAELKDPASAKPLMTILADVKEASDARAAAARVLGKLGIAEAVPALAKIAQTEEGGQLLHACAGALGELGDKKAAPALRESLRRASARMKTKIVGANKIDYSDYENVCDDAEAVVRALGKIGDPAAAPDIVAFPVEALLLASLEVDASARAGQNPESPKKRLARASIEALEALANPAASAALEKLRSIAAK